jgi:hypothetical protein
LDIICRGKMFHVAVEASQVPGCHDAKASKASVRAPTNGLAA